MLNTLTYHNKAENLLEEISFLFENLNKDIDIDWQVNQLVIEVNPQKKYLINKHEPSQQVWMASPFSGAHHFHYSESLQEWHDTRSGQRWDEFLKSEIDSNVT